MAGRTRTKKHAPQKTQTDVMTQTSPDKTAEEINRLKEETNSLKEELRRLRKQLQSNSSPQQQRKEVVIVAQADSPQQNKILIKGCNCKGKCVSKACGCVKKQVPCTAACKCTPAKCINKDHEKENIDGVTAQAQISPGIETSTKLMSTLKLKENHAGQGTRGMVGSSNDLLNQASKPGRSLFSPETPTTCRNEVPIGELQLNTPIHFGDSKKITNIKSSSSVQGNKIKKQSAHRDQLKVSPDTAVYGRGKGGAGKPNKKKLISPYYDGKNRRPVVWEIEDVAGLNSSIEDIPTTRKEKAKNLKQDTIQTAVNSYGYLQRLQNSTDFDNEQLDFTTIDPMKPTRQLQRTPVSATSKQNQPRRSESPTYRDPVEVEKQSIVPPPEGINEPQVDWDQHCAQLVPCKHCNRTFYPFRLQKHEASCKRV